MNFQADYGEDSLESSFVSISIIHLECVGRKKTEETYLNYEVLLFTVFQEYNAWSEMLVSYGI